MPEPSMPTAASLLDAALRAAPRRYRLRPMPADAESARADGAPTAVAFALEAARVSQARGVPLAPGVEQTFLDGLAELIRSAMRGDPAYRAMVLRRHDPEVDAYARSVEAAARDGRSVRASVDALAHPGKLRRRGADPAVEPLAALHALATAAAWPALRTAIDAALAGTAGDDAPTAAALRRLQDDPALARLGRGQALLGAPGVQRYRAWLDAAGPRSGSTEAAASGRAASQRGGQAEAEVVAVFARVADRLNAAAGGPAYRVARSLRTPGTLGASSRAKAEWDAAIVRERAGAAAVDIALLAEVKSSPAAATADWPRMRAGLAHLARARADAVVALASPDGPLPVTGESLRRLQPHGDALPDHVVYCCSAEPEARPPLLSAVSRAGLLSEPASLAYAARLLDGDAPGPDALAPVWRHVATSPRGRALRCQDVTARAAREAMLHPDDLLQAVRHGLGAGPR